MKYTPVPNNQYTDEMAKRDARVIKKAIKDAPVIDDTPKIKCSHCEGKTGSKLSELCPKHQKAWIKARVNASMEIEYGEDYKNIK